MGGHFVPPPPGSETQKKPRQNRVKGVKTQSLIIQFEQWNPRAWQSFKNSVLIAILFLRFIFAYWFVWEDIRNTEENVSSGDHLEICPENSASYHETRAFVLSVSHKALLTSGPSNKLTQMWYIEL